MQVTPQVQGNLRNHCIFKAPGLRLGRLIVCTQAHKTFLRHLDLHLLYLAQLAVSDKLFEFTNHGVASVVVGGTEEPLGVGHGLSDVIPLCNTGGERLLANYGETCVQSIDNDILMIIGRRQHHHGIQLALFGLQQVTIISVGAIVSNAPSAGGLAVRFSVGAERARH